MTNITGAKRKISSSDEGTSSRGKKPILNRSETDAQEDQIVPEIPLSLEEKNRILDGWTNDTGSKLSQGNKQATINNLKNVLNNKEKKLHFREGQLQNCPDVRIVYDLKHLTNLTMKKNSLVNYIRILDGLTNLVKLDITFNKFTSVPEAIRTFQKLETLNLEGNEIKELPEFIAELKNLNHLNVQKNQLEALPESLGNLPKLKKLQINNNHITHLPQGFAKLKKLEILDISSNHIQSLPDIIGGCIKLKKLLAFENPLSFISEQIGQLTSLQELCLSTNNLEKVPDAIWSLKELTDISFSNHSKTDISNFEEVDLQHVQKLKALNFFGHKKLKSFKNLEKLTQLKSLKLNNTSVKFEDLPEEVRHNEKIYIDIRPPKPQTEQTTGTSSSSKAKEEFSAFVERIGVSSLFKQPHIEIKPIYPEKIISKNDIYRILGLSENVDLETFKKTYNDNKKKIFLKYHPDKAKDIPQEQATTNFQNIDIFYNQIIREKTSYLYLKR